MHGCREVSGGERTKPPENEKKKRKKNCTKGNESDAASTRKEIKGNWLGERWKSGRKPNLFRFTPGAVQQEKTGRNSQ